MPARRAPTPQQLVLPELLVAPPPVAAAPRPPDPERERRKARSMATLAAVIRNLAHGTRADAAEVG